MHNRLIRIALVFAFLSAGAALAGVYEDILAAVHNNDTPAVVGLIDRGMDVNTADPAGTTLLMVAARNGNQELLEFLLKRRANFSIINRYGDSALSLAALQGHLKIVQFLGEMGAPMNQEGWAALHYAAYAGHRDVVAYLLSKGADIDAPAPNGQTARQLADSKEHKEVVELLDKQKAAAPQ